MSENWSQSHLQHWQSSKCDVYFAIAQMIHQYSNTEVNFDTLNREIAEDWRTICKYISPTRITTSVRGYVNDDTESLLVSLHCLAIIVWDKIYDKFNTDLEHDVRHDFMNAGEAAVEQLVNFGLMRPLHGGGKWTSLGSHMLSGKLR